MTFQLADRVRQPELMDEPGLDQKRHRQALRGLERVNRISRSGSALWSVIRDRFPNRSADPIRVLDLACGGGDVARRLAVLGMRAGLDLRITGRDASATAIAHAREASARQGLSRIEFEQGDALAPEVEPQGFDVVCCTLFLHHLDRDDAVILLRRMASASRRLVLVDDLRRSALGYAMAWVGCRLLSRSPIVHYDGPLSVRSAFTEREALAIAEEAGLIGAVASRHWPQRFLLRWERA